MLQVWRVDLDEDDEDGRLGEVADADLEDDVTKEREEDEAMGRKMIEQVTYDSRASEEERSEEEDGGENVTLMRWRNGRREEARVRLESSLQARSIKKRRINIEVYLFSLKITFLAYQWVSKLHAFQHVTGLTSVYVLLIVFEHTQRTASSISIPLVGHLVLGEISEKGHTNRGIVYDLFFLHPTRVAFEIS